MQSIFTSKGEKMEKKPHKCTQCDYASSRADDLKTNSYKSQSSANGAITPQSNHQALQN